VVGGQATVSGFHLQEGNGKTIETGSLEDGGFEVILDGDTLSPSDRMSFAVGEDHVLTVSGRFLGILVRLEADDGVDTSAALSEGSNRLQNAGVCAAPVVGITHNSNAVKNDAEVILRLDEASEVALDITIVLANDNVESIFYYSGFALAAVDPSDAESGAPSSAPSWIPSTLPSSTPVSASSVPSLSPSELPSVSPSPLPSLSNPPSIRPSLRLSPAPSWSPSSTPSKTTSTAPSRSSSTAPSWEPSNMPSSAPTFPSCNVCGGDLVIGSPDTVLNDPFDGTIMRTCAAFDARGQEGLIAPQCCTVLTGLVRDPCECRSAPTESPTAVPVVTATPTITGQTQAPYWIPSDGPSTTQSPTLFVRDDTSFPTLSLTMGPTPAFVGDFAPCNICGDNLVIGNLEGIAFNPVEMTRPTCEEFDACRFRL
jgi:hypothetical protein